MINMGLFGVIGHVIKRFGEIGKNMIGKFGHFFHGGNHQAKEEPNYPQAPVPGYPAGQHPDHAPRGNIIDRARQHYGGNAGRMPRDSRLQNLD